MGSRYLSNDDMEVWSECRCEATDSVVRPAKGSKQTYRRVILEEIENRAKALKISKPVPAQLASSRATEESLVSITQMAKLAPVDPDTLAGYLIAAGVEIVPRGGNKQRFADFNATCDVMKKHRLDNVPSSIQSVASREKNFRRRKTGETSEKQST